nr:MAG TPA: hypothetical protein [Caudoviricetes sp.]
MAYLFLGKIIRSTLGWLSKVVSFASQNKTSEHAYVHIGCPY